MLSLLGAALPHHVLGPGAGNERGHWEPTRILLLNEEILRCLNSSWYDHRALSQDWFDGREAKSFAERAAALIDEEFGGERLIVLKEPRISRLTPLYIEALQQAGYETRVIIPLRHPGEVMHSLWRRDGLDPETGECIWIRHSIEAEFATRQCPRIWVTYDGLLKDWRTLEARVSVGLDLRWARDPEDAAHAIEAFLEPKLRHFDLRGEAGPAAVGSLSGQLWQAAQHGLADNEARLQAGFDAVSLRVSEGNRTARPEALDEMASFGAVASARSSRASTLWHRRHHPAIR